MVRENTTCPSLMPAPHSTAGLWPPPLARVLIDCATTCIPHAAHAATSACNPPSQQNHHSLNPPSIHPPNPMCCVNNSQAAPIPGHNSAPLSPPLSFPGPRTCPVTCPCCAPECQPRICSPVQWRRAGVDELGRLQQQVRAAAGAGRRRAGMLNLNWNVLPAHWWVPLLQQPCLSPCSCSHKGQRPGSPPCPEMD